MEADFASVWSRVTGTPVEPPESLLRRFLKETAEAQRALNAAAALTCDALIRSKLNELQSAACRRRKRLRAALYLLTGERDCPAASECVCPCSLTAALRQLYQSAEKSAAAYAQAAKSADRASLRSLYSELSEECRKEADCLLRLTERLF